MTKRGWRFGLLVISLGLALTAAAPARAGTATGLSGLPYPSAINDSDTFALCQNGVTGCSLQTWVWTQGRISDVANYLAARSTVLTNKTLSCNANTCTNIPSSALSVTGVTAGSYTCLSATVNAAGQLTAASNGTCSGGGGSVSITAGNAGIAVSPSPLTGTGTISLALSGGGAQAHQWVSSLSPAGAATLSQPAFADLSGLAAAAQMPAFSGDFSTPAGTTVATLATVNSAPGSTTCSNITTNAKGLVTANSNGTCGGGTTTMTLGAGLAATPTTYNAGTQTAANGSTITPQLFLVARATSCAVNSNCNGSSTNDSGAYFVATAAGVTFTVPNAAAAGTGGFSFGYDGSHPYALSTAGSAIYGTCGSGSTSVSGIAEDVQLTSDGANWKCSAGGPVYGKSLAFTSNVLNIANPLTAVSGTTSCTAALAAASSTCNSASGDDQSTLLLSNTATNCAVASGGVCAVTLSASSPVNYLCFINTAQPAAANAPNEGLWIVEAATGAKILPAAGAATGNPWIQSSSGTGAPLFLAPGGRLCVQNQGAATFLPTEYYPGAWFVNFNGTSSATITGLAQGASGVTVDQYQLTCNGFAPSTGGDALAIEFYYGGTLQTSGYNWALLYGQSASTATNVNNSTAQGSSAIELVGSMDTIGDVQTAGGEIDVTITNSLGTGGGYRAAVHGTSGFYSYSSAAEAAGTIAGRGPLQGAAGLAGIYLYGDRDASNWSGWCRLAPRSLQ